MARAREKKYHFGWDTKKLRNYVALSDLTVGMPSPHLRFRHPATRPFFYPSIFTFISIECFCGPLPTLTGTPTGTTAMNSPSGSPRN